jgi:AcrR family transcriptional regulator
VSVATVAPELLPADGVETRAMGAMLACIGRFGLSKTTLDDVAREAGCSRATLYRYFESKSELVWRTVLAEQTRVTAVVVDAGRASSTFADAVVAAVTAAARELVGSNALQFLLAHEPEAILGHLAFGPGDRVLVTDPVTARRFLEAFVIPGLETRTEP